MSQRVGNISGSKGVDIRQTSDGTSVQEVGDISSSEGVRVDQRAMGALLREAHDGMREVLQLIDAGDEELRHKVVADARAEVVRAAGQEEFPAAVLVEAKDRAEVDESVPEETRSAIRDLSTAVGLASGTVAIAQITDPRVLLLAIPAVLLLSGYLSAPRLRAMCVHILEIAKRRALALADRKRP